MNLQGKLFILHDSFSSVDHTLSNPFSEGGPSGKVFFWIKGFWLKEEENLEQVSCCKYEELFGVNPIIRGDYFGPFHNVEELRRFAYLLCLDLEGESVHLFSQESFNTIIKYCPDKRQLLEELLVKSDSLDNMDRSTGKSFLDKIFSKD